MHILEIKCNEDHAHISVARLASGRAIAFLPGSSSYTLVRFEEKKKTCPFLKNRKKPRAYLLKSKTAPSWGSWQLLAQDWECSLWRQGSGLPTLTVPDSSTNNPGGRPLQLSVAGETLCQHKIYHFPFLLL